MCVRQENEKKPAICSDWPRPFPGQKMKIAASKADTFPRPTPRNFARSLSTGACCFHASMALAVVGYLY